MYAALRHHPLSNGEEIALGADLRDWASDQPTANECSLLDTDFRFFTQSDIEVADNLSQALLPILQPLTVQMMMAAFTNMETVHTHAHALLSKTLACPKPSSKPFATTPRCAPRPIMNQFGVETVADMARTPRHVRCFRGMACLPGSPCCSIFPNTTT
jgi:ribonucleoside-diphosphate reductase beta chain